MKYRAIRTIAAASVATIVVSICLTSCEGRRMSNMVPAGETVEVEIEPASSAPDAFPAPPAPESPDTL